MKLTAQQYTCNIAIYKVQDTEDIWFIANNIFEPHAIREYLDILKVVDLI